MSYFVYAKELLGVRINAPNFDWSYGRIAPLADEKLFLECKFKVFIDIRKDKDVFEDECFRTELPRFQYWWGHESEKMVYYEKLLFGSVHLRCSIKIENNSVYVVVGKTYFKHIRFRFMNLHALEYILMDVISGLLLINGYCPLYCSAVSLFEQQRSVLIFSPPNTGKTTAAVQLCQNHGASFVSEDIAITDGSSVWAVPWTGSYRDLSFIGKKDSKWKRLFPMFNQMNYRKRRDILANWGEITYRTDVSDIFLIEKKPNFTQEPPHAMLLRLELLNRYLFNYQKSPTVVILNWFYPDFSIDQMYRNEKEILKKLVSIAKPHVLSVDKNANCARQIFDILQ